MEKNLCKLKARAVAASLWRSRQISPTRLLFDLFYRNHQRRGKPTLVLYENLPDAQGGVTAGERDSSQQGCSLLHHYIDAGS